MKNPKFQIFEGRDGQFYFRLRAANGEIIAQSEGYTSKEGAENGIASVKENAPIAPVEDLTDDTGTPAPQRKPRYVLFKGEDGEYYFNLQAPNYEIILQSEGYTSKDGAENGIASVRKNSDEETQYRRLVSTNGQFYFTLVAKNYQVIGVSEMYTTREAREIGIEAVMKYGPDAPVVDKTN